MSWRNLEGDHENSGDRAALNGILIGLGASFLGGGEFGTAIAVAAGLAIKNVGREIVREKDPWYEALISGISAAVVLGRMNSQKLVSVWETAVAASQMIVGSLPLPVDQIEAAGKFYGWIKDMPPVGVAAILGLVIVGPPTIRALSRRQVLVV